MVTPVIDSNLAVPLLSGNVVFLTIAMSWVQNLLISIGAFWLSRQPVVLMSLTIGRLGSGASFGESVLSAIAFGLWTSVGRVACAILGAAIVSLSVSSARPQRWALVVAFLYAVFASPRGHYLLQPTTWDNIARAADLLWPSLFCIATAMLIARFRQNQPPKVA